MEHTNFMENVTRHPLYKDYVNHESAYGAERWLATLQRTCERIAYSMIQLEPNETLGGDIFSIKIFHTLSLLTSSTSFFLSYFHV